MSVRVRYERWPDTEQAPIYSLFIVTNDAPAHIGAVALDPETNRWQARAKCHFHAGAHGKIKPRVHSGLATRRDAAIWVLLDTHYFMRRPALAVAA